MMNVVTAVIVFGMLTACGYSRCSAILSLVVIATASLLAVADLGMLSATGSRLNLGLLELAWEQQNVLWETMRVTMEGLLKEGGGVGDGGGGAGAGNDVDSASAGSRSIFDVFAAVTRRGF